MSRFDDTLKKYMDIFANQETYFVTDTRNLELFRNTPGNASTENVQMKVSAINDTELRRHDIEEAMVAHIIKLNIDSRLLENDLSIVEEIAHIVARGQSWHMLRFASMYCNFHKPEIYPIFSDEHLDFYRRFIAENKLPLDASKLNTYEVFSKALNELVSRLGLTGKMNYLQIRKFGWLYAQTVVNESKA